MLQSECRLLRVLLGFICVLLMCMSAAPDLCGPLKTVRDSLNSTLRRRYMKMNFPINYTIQVHYEEVYRLRNISRLRNESLVELRDLQDLWVLVSQQGIKRILKVLPERHPTRRKYLSNLENLFRDFQVLYIQQNPRDEERELPESIQNICDKLRDPYYQGWKSVTPKSLLDNCYRSMLCLFKDCFSTEDDSYDYCEVLNRRKEKKTT
ncbi:interleukin-34-like [Myxocyprinus asiaticus]|uniref:interleukin-34-like n=1 Tax=Myxocyprinus asiaticus TaxID=70543 RepID=UPI0022218B5F|nr:interleukin-34-like [Myxocyprinus asiaticus]XP_051580999.1 interleukin-34-like [Myxocyprinus asiaticus]XP_051581000.1 interleukin-34-like [Myxocyprinus asiaticus]